MTSLQKIQLRLSEVAVRLGAIADLEGESFTDEIRSEAAALQVEHGELHTRQQAAIVSEGAEQAAHQGHEGDGDGTPSEIRSLLQRSSAANYLSRATAGLQIDGAEAELNAALEIGTIGAGGGTLIPWQMLDVPEELRADVPSITTGQGSLAGPITQRSILQRLFGRDVLEALGVRVDSVPSGQAQWPLLTGGVAPDQKAEAVAAPDAAAPTFTTQILTPKRLTGKYQFSVEQAAQVSGIEEALRFDLASAVRAKMSDQVINGSGAAGQVTGLLTRIDAPGVPATEADYEAYSGLPASGVDGIHANGESEVSVILGVDSYRHAASTIQAGTAISALEVMARRGRSVIATNFIPGKTNANVQNANLLHSGADAMRGDSIAAVWPAMEIIRDPYSAAASGIVSLTWISLWDAYTAFRAAAYKRVSLKLA